MLAAAPSDAVFDLATPKPDILQHPIVKLAKLSNCLLDLRLLSRPAVKSP
jgi:hypothetical protein